VNGTNFTRPHHKVPGLPGEGTVDLWYVLPDAVGEAALLERYGRLLSAEERERRERFARQTDRHLFLVSRALLRCVLSHYVPVEPQAWVFRAGRFGKPEVASPEAGPLRFNLSHTRGLVVCGIARCGQLGVDAERIEPARARLELARRYFAPEETALLEATSGERRAELFFRLWTLKEAFLKARGTGLATGLDRFAIELSDARPPRVVVRRRMDRAAEKEPACWQFAEIRLEPEHQVGVALGTAEQMDLRVTLRRCVPLLQADPPQVLPASVCRRWCIAQDMRSKGAG